MFGTREDNRGHRGGFRERRPSPAMVVAASRAVHRPLWSRCRRHRWQFHPRPAEYGKFPDRPDVEQRGAGRSTSPSRAPDPRATALGLNVPAGKAPLTVNSDTRVANLNADKLDGRDVTQLTPANAATRIEDVNIGPFTNQSVISVGITTVGTSVLLAHGALEVENRDTVAGQTGHGVDVASCFVRVDGTRDSVRFATGIPDTVPAGRDITRRRRFRSGRCRHPFRRVDVLDRVRRCRC